MGFAEFVRSMFSREEAGYSAIVSSEGIVFDSPQHELCKQGKATGKIQSQFIFLQMMKETVCRFRKMVSEAGDPSEA